MRVLTYLTLALAPFTAFGQSAETAPKFEVADIHASAHANQPIVRGPFFNSRHYELRFASMLDLIRTAYDVDPEKVYGGPSWLEMDRFDLFAQTPPGATAEQRRLMLQALLADRFKLVLRHDTKPMAAYVLTAPKHSGLKEADGSGEPGCTFAVSNPPPPPPPAGGAPPVITLPVIVYTCRSVTMNAFAMQLPALAGTAQYFGNRPVADQTALPGAWDFSFKFTPKIPAGIPVAGDNIPLFESLEKLGLKLEPSTVPLPVLVVESVNQKPTPNSPEAMKAFPPLPTEFEVADLKPSAPTAGRGGQGPRPDIKNGRVYLPGMTLKNMILIAWDLNGDEMLANAPKWLDDDRFDILAKAPEDVAIGNLSQQQRSAIPVNIDALRPMIRSLIVERFKLEAHTEQRPVDTYILTAPKPKLAKADPSSRTRWQEGAAPDSKNNKNANAALGRLVTCQNITMAQFADMLPGIAPGYVRTLVQNATGLEGGWDFTFSFSPAGVLQMAPGPRPDGSASEASDPSGAVSLFDAVTKQLGLKLDTQKRPMPVLVIDRVERKPTEN